MSREQRLQRLEQYAVVEEAPVLTDAERDRRLQALFELYEARGWKSCGESASDKQHRGIVGLMVRAAERAAKQNPTPETLEQAACWQDRLARFTAAPQS